MLIDNMPVNAEYFNSGAAVAFCSGNTQQCQMALGLYGDEKLTRGIGYALVAYACYKDITKTVLNFPYLNCGKSMKEISQDSKCVEEIVKDDNLVTLFNTYGLQWFTNFGVTLQSVSNSDLKAILWLNQGNSEKNVMYLNSNEEFITGIFNTIYFQPNTTGNTTSVYFVIGANYWNYAYAYANHSVGGSWGTFSINNKTVVSDNKVTQLLNLSEYNITTSGNYNVAINSQYSGGGSGWIGTRK